MRGLTPEQESVLSARAQVAIVDGLERVGKDIAAGVTIPDALNRFSESVNANHGVRLARQMVADADAGRRGLDPSLMPPPGVAEQQRRRDDWPVPPMNWPAPKTSGAIPGTGSDS